MCDGWSLAGNLKVMRLEMSHNWERACNLIHSAIRSKYFIFSVSRISTYSDHMCLCVVLILKDHMTEDWSSDAEISFLITGINYSIVFK